MKQIMQKGELYINWFCSHINHWARRSAFSVRGEIEYSPKLGIAVITIHEYSKRSKVKTLFRQHETTDELQTISKRIKRMLGKHSSDWSLYAFGRIAYSSTKIRYVKPLVSGYWTKEIALWDAQMITCQILQAKRGV